MAAVDTINRHDMMITTANYMGINSRPEIADARRLEYINGWKCRDVSYNISGYPRGGSRGWGNKKTPMQTHWGTYKTRNTCNLHDLQRCKVTHNIRILQFD